MPSTAPNGIMPCVGLVFARLVVHNEDRGIRPFIVHINDGAKMCNGIEAR